ncbi:hypothetical protein [Streptomyces sp. NPDC059349]|uniref:hypothetical protein n=1 Tax=Streptomyces sp. NPDC059349 TaxID=3346808 RepID=UPI0036A51A22
MFVQLTSVVCGASRGLGGNDPAFTLRTYVHGPPPQARGRQHDGAHGGEDERSIPAGAPDLTGPSPPTYRNLRIDYACAGPKLPRRLVAKAHRIRKN